MVLALLLPLKGLRGARIGSSAEAADVVAPGRSTGLSFNESQLQHEFVHAPDFGVGGTSTGASRLEFMSEIVDHVDAPRTTVIEGTYHGQPVVHYVDPETGVNVFTTPEGGFWGAWRLSSEQIWDVIVRGSL